MRRILLFLSVLLLLASCKTQKVTSTRSSSGQDSTKVSAIKLDTLSPDTTAIVMVLDSVQVDIHRLLRDTIRIKAVGDIMLGTNFPDSTYLP